LLADESEKNIVAFRRKRINGSSVIVILSFSGVDQQITLPLLSGNVENMFDTGNIGCITDKIEVQKSGKQFFATVNVPAFSGMILSDKKKINKKTLKEN
jgi:hypothetical protein